jgi:hypothetical protein
LTVPGLTQLTLYDVRLGDGHMTLEIEWSGGGPQVRFSGLAAGWQEEKPQASSTGASAPRRGR